MELHVVFWRYFEDTFNSGRLFLLRLQECRWNDESQSDSVRLHNQFYFFDRKVKHAYDR